MNRTAAGALIVTRPGRVREALQGLVAALPGLGTPWLADDLAQARRLAGHGPVRAAVLGPDLPWADAQALSAELRAASPQTGVVLLTEAPPPEPYAPAAGEAVLRSGTPAGRLIAVLEALLAATA